MTPGHGGTPRILALKTNSHPVCGPSRMLEACLGNVDPARVMPVLGLLAAPGLAPPVHFTSPLTAHLERHEVPWRGHLRAPAAARALRRLVREQHIDGVHSHDMRSDWLCALAGGRRGLGVPWVAHLHGWLGAHAAPGMRLRELAHALAIRGADEVWVAAERARRQARRCLRPGTPVRVLRNAVDPRVLAGSAAAGVRLRRALRLPEGTLLAGTAARMERFKGHRLLAEATVASGVPELHAVLLGFGPAEAELRAMAASPPFAGRVVVPGAMPPADVLGLVAALDIFALPSLAESLPIAVLEAMSLGRPVIASEVGDLRWALGDGSAGVLVPPGDVAALAVALRLLAEDRAARERLGAAALARARAEFAPRRLARQFEDGWLALIAGGGG